MLKVIIADDQSLLRESLGHIINSSDEFKVVALAANGEEVINLCKKCEPDLILMDIKMPGIGGVEATKKIKTLNSNIKIIMLTTFEDEENIMESFSVGADAYILKSITHNELLDTLKCVSKDLTVIDKSVKDLMLKKFNELDITKSKYMDVLTEKDLSVIRLIANGKSNKDIANFLNYSEGTIKNHVSKILQKLNLSDRLQVAIFAIENKII